MKAPRPAGPLPVSLEQAAGREALRVALARGTPIAFPTESSYALGGNALLPSLAARIYALKGRERGKPLLLLVDGRSGVEPWAAAPSAAVRRLLARCWPGPLTLVLPAGPGLPAHLRDGRGNVALRWSPHPTVESLLRLGGVPLIGTSANPSGAPSLHSHQEVLAAFPEPDLLIVAGATPPGQAPSTVLDTTTFPMRVLREGAIGAPALRAALEPDFAALAP